MKPKRVLILWPLLYHCKLSLVAAGSTGHTLQQLHKSFLGSTTINDLNLNLLSSHISGLTSSDDGSEI
ncbi:hypothetical protein PanWU01x14_296260 [Parasponia andersonii]|uniref:Uncharacterized protein n=1 Tax=Parasponia andersonii TaxID=3476 RepID=A0A2P5AVN6_PARAD|nr:hypothetical protein PanWU01x14_296260 [Parasponia andersonii]